MEGISKKISIRTVLTVYALSFMINSLFFVDWGKVVGASTSGLTKIVAVIVDKDLYPNIQTDVSRYTTKYIQARQDNTKAIVLPINIKTISAADISKMLENIYFEGIKDTPSKLAGVVLIGDVPLPVIQDNGFIYPSIFPYVDFEHQQYIYDQNIKFFIPNDNANGQAEIWHGILNFSGVQAYKDYFIKLKTYSADPTKFVSSEIWYDDLIGTKKYYINENTRYYINNQIFAEDKGYHRLNNLLLNTIKGDHNESVSALGSTLANDIADSDNAEMKAYATMISNKEDAAKISLQTMENNEMPTMVLSKSIQELSKTYDDLLSTQLLTKMKDNVQASARRYSQDASGNWMDNIDSHYEKIVQKDNRVSGDQPLLIQFNTAMESGINTKIEEEKYYMTIPIPVSELNFEGKEKGILRKKCTWGTYNYYENYFFGVNANTITSAQDTSIYRGTYQNLTSLSGQSITNTGKSVGSSYDVFSTQIEANRGYDFNSAVEETERYQTSKTNKQDLWYLKCPKYFLNWKWLNVCLKPRKRSVNDSSDQNKCIIGDTSKQGGCETLTDFATRNRGGASPMNVNTTTQKLSTYNYQNAVLPIYNIAGAKEVDTAQPAANSYSGAMTYTTMIQKKFSAGDMQYGSNKVSALIANPTINGSNLIFTNKLPVGDLEHPTRIPVIPKTYSQTNLFTLFGAVPNHSIIGGKLVMYTTSPGDCGGKGTIYTYKTIDSRVLNISPTPDQISSKLFYKFKDTSDLNLFYTSVISDLALIQTDIAKTSIGFSGTSITDITGVVSNLSQLKTMIATYNNSMNQIITFSTGTLLGYTATQIAQLANTRSANSLSTAKIIEMSGRISKVNEGLESLLNYMDVLNIDTVVSSLANIMQSEKLKKQNVEILDSRKTNITANLNNITTNINALKSTFTNAQNIYTSIGQINDNILSLQNKRIAIAALQGGNGCNPTYYKAVCDVLSTIITTLQNNLSDINTKIIAIHQYQGDEDENGIPVTVQPFVEINQLLSSPEIINGVGEVRATMDTFAISTNPEQVEEKKGMNLTTQDRPIDSIRNITFQGVGGDAVRFNYPNLYKVYVYKTVNDTLVLKTPEEILNTLTGYLQSKVAEYNRALTGQRNKKVQYYTANANAFNFLAQLDPLASPNNRSYTLLDTNFFINQLLTSLNTLITTYGKTAIYGDEPASTNVEKLMLIARLLRYQNSTWVERKTTTTVTDDIQEIRDTFNINQKIGDTVSTYLQRDNNKGKFISPTYNATGYEVAYINSDGSDLIQASDVPAFIQQLQAIQTEKAVANKIEIEKSTQETTMESECGIGNDGTALLFDIKTFKSPWFAAMKCRAKNQFKIKVSVNFKNAQGPTIAGFLGEVGNALETQANQRKNFTSDAQASDQESNDNAMANASPAIQQNLKIYTDSAEIKTSASSRFVDSTGARTLTVNSQRPVGATKVILSATGEVCLGIQQDKIISSNLCKQEVSFTLGQEPQNYIFTQGNTKAGTMVITAKFCFGGSQRCISKSKSIEILAGPVTKVQILPATNIVMAGAEIPVNIRARDKYGNVIGQVVENYDILTETGTINSAQKVRFNSFSNANFIYQAPKGIQQNTTIILKVQGTNQAGKTIISEQKVTIAKGFINVYYKDLLSTPIFTTYPSLARAVRPTIYTLPNLPQDLLKRDIDNIVQLQKNAITKLTITLHDKPDSRGKKNMLETAINVISKNNILTPGQIVQNVIELSGQNKIQTKFQAQGSILVQSGKVEIWLYPTLKAGNEEIILNVPGMDPISIPITVAPSTAEKVVITQADTSLTLDTDSTIQGEIYLTDHRGNPITQSTGIKIGIIGPGLIDGQKTKELTRTGTAIRYTLQATGQGGNGYLFAYLASIPLNGQVPGQQMFFVQKDVIPTQNLNVMYLNYFGSDRGNQRGYFSDNDKKVNGMTQGSEKLLTTTTSLIDPNKIKQIQITVSPDGQLQNLTDKASTLMFISGQVIHEIDQIGTINIGRANEFIVQMKDIETLQTRGKDRNAFLYIPEPTDSVISGNTIKGTKLLINQQSVIDFAQGTSDPNILIQTNGEETNGMTQYDILRNQSKIGILVLYKKTNLITSTNVAVRDPIKYSKGKVFTAGSTNAPMGIAIYDQQSSYTKNGYQSIEDSADPLLGIGFTSKFKNITYFAAGQTVGNATLPYGSAFLINFGDPLVQRISDSIKVSKTDVDGSIGQNIFSNPDKTILQVVPADINNDGIKDMIIAYTDGSIQVVKNYGANDPYQNLQNLMIIADVIKEIKVGDVNDDAFPDIIIQTNQDKIIVYQNREGVFDVDGTPVCLNTNVGTNEISSTPDNLAGVHQIFLEDMDQDGNMDIVTNDLAGDVKIFYGGKTSDGKGYYISTLTSVCDDNRFARQKNNYQTVKSFGLQVKNDLLITDESLVHYKDMQTPDDTDMTDTEVVEDDPAPLNEDGTAFTKDDAMVAVNDLVQNTATYTVIGAKDLAYTDNPTTKIPTYENNTTADKVVFLPISKLSGEKVSIYKQYADLNGGTLKNGDQVRITTTLLSLSNNNKITYLDQLKGPWVISKSKAGEISGLIITGTHVNTIKVYQDVGPEYQVMLDNIVLQNKESIQLSYIVKYQQGKLTKIIVKDEAITSPAKPKDGVPDIIVQTTDACVKSSHVIRNTKSSRQGNKTYLDIFNDLDTAVAESSSAARKAQEDQLGDTFQQITATNAQTIAALPGMSEILEQWDRKDLFANGGLNVNLNTDFIDNMTEDVSKYLDGKLKDLCQGFKVGGKSCQGIPMPFNQAFLAPGEYHLFGCVPKVPNPLFPLFAALNKTLGRGLPAISVLTAPPYVAFFTPPSSISQVRLYVAPTMTLGIGFAICVGPYALGVALPKPFRDIVGNCVVFAIPAITSCKSSNSQSDTSTTKGGDEYDPTVVSAAENGSCEAPPAIGNTIVFASSDNTIDTNEKGASSPLQSVAIQGSISNPFVPQGNFGGLIQIDQEPIIETPTDTQDTQGTPTQLTPGNKVNLKIVGGKAKGIVNCIIKTWMTRQLKYIINNITNMSIQVNLPDMTTLVQGFGNLKNITKIGTLNQQDVAGGYAIQSKTGFKNNIPLNKKQRESISQKIGQNPFEAIALMFKDVPLIKINTKDINVKVPTITSEEIVKYQSYLQSWLKKNVKILEDWTSALNKILALCGTTDKTEAKKIKDELTAQVVVIEDGKIKDAMQSEIDNMQTIIDLPQDTTREKMGSDIINMQLNFNNTIKKVATLPVRKGIQTFYVLKKAKQKGAFTEQSYLDSVDARVASIEKCSGIAGSMDGFLTFKENTAQLFSSVQENIKVLDQYKRFPGQLYEWIHIVDRYLGEISSIISEFVGGLTYWLTTNANRFSQYVDAITLIVGAIKTRQAIIDFSVNRSEKCSKCSNDNYGSFSCSLSFLCPQLPIFKIPPFKIPDITLDLSHIELGVDILLPKFNFVPIKLPLPQLPNLPEPPNVEVSLDIDIDFGFGLGVSLPTIPTIPSPPILPELPSFLPNVDLKLPILPPAPKIPKILPEIKVVLKIANFIGKIFCIVKGGIGLVAEKGVKGKVEQITQRTRNVPIFDFFDLTSKYKDPPLEGFDYEMDAYVRLKYNFEGIYSVIDGLAQTANQAVAQTIEAPMQKAMDKVNDVINNNSGTEFLNNVPGNVDLNINGFIPMNETGLEYADAYKQLQEGLQEFKQQGAGDKRILAKIQEIDRVINAPSEVQAATEQINQAKQAADGIVNQSRKEVQDRANKIKDYDNFVTDLQQNQIQLVSETTTQATISAPLITMNESTKNIISNQESPTKTYLTLNEGLVDGYLKVINNSDAVNLNMTTDTYDKSKAYLNTVKAKIALAETTIDPGTSSSNKLTQQSQILAANTCIGGNCQASIMEENGYKQDLSAYVKGIFVETGVATGKTMVNVVNNPTITSEIGKQYLQSDFNNDTKEDILLRDANNIYLKYADQNNEHLTQGGNSLGSHTTTAYTYQGNGKRWIDSPQDLNALTDGYAKFGNIMIKLRTTHAEVKNFRTEGQSFDTIQLTWKNSAALGEPVEGYIIKYSYHVQNFFEKIRKFSFFGNDISEVKYILVLPDDTNYATGLLSVGSINRQRIDKLLTGTITSVRSYDPALDTIAITLNDMPRKWIYAQIATLQQDPSQLGRLDKKSTMLFTPGSPWSNQIVAGNQLLGDNIGPVADITLERISTKEIISTGNTHEGFINTRYRLQALWKDNTAVKDMTIFQNDTAIYHKTGTNITGRIDIPDLFFTGADQRTFTFEAIDANNNISQEVVNLHINIPGIEILDVKQIDAENAEIIAKLEQDLDEGIVTFQRERNGTVKAITGTKANNLGGYSLAPGKQIITGGIMSVGDMLGLYTPTGEEIGSINPDNGEITINATWQDKVFLKLDFLLHIPTIKVMQTSNNQELFQISLPAEKLANIAMVQGKPNYELITLSESSFGAFQGGYCIKNTDSECIFYVNALGKIYIPSSYASTLGGSYSFDSKLKNIVYTVTDEQNAPIAKIFIKTQNLITK